MNRPDPLPPCVAKTTLALKRRGSAGRHAPTAGITIRGYQSDMPLGLLVSSTLHVPSWPFAKPTPGTEYRLSLVIISGSAGLIGSQAARHFHDLGYEVWGIDNDSRAGFFGPEASTRWMQRRLENDLAQYTHFDVDIRDTNTIDSIFRRGGPRISLVIHTAAQPSHDWAAREPSTDFTVNANGTLSLLEATRSRCPDAAFIFTSTNKVYGDTPNRLPFVELETRFEVAHDHPFFGGIPETMNIDQSTHSLFRGIQGRGGPASTGVRSLLRACHRLFPGWLLDRPGSFGRRTPRVPRLSHAVHGVRPCHTRFTATGESRSATISIVPTWCPRSSTYARDPRPAAVYNIGGGRFSNCSMLEAITLCEGLAGRSLDWTYSETNRIGDHMWWISDLSTFESDYPEWELRYDVPAILSDIYEHNAERWMDRAS